VPCRHYNKASISYNTIKNFDNELVRLNAKLFYELNKYKRQNIDTNNLLDKPQQIQLENQLSECLFFDCIFKKLKANLNSKNFIDNSKKIPFLSQSLEFRFQFIYELSKTKFSKFQNISKSQADALSYFSKEKPFVVLEADKNVGACIISKELEETIGLDCLSDTNTYEKLNYNPLDRVSDLVRTTINGLVETKQISKNLGKYLIVKNCKMRRFRLLPKIHKTKFSIRPIINCRDSPTSNLCLFLYLLLQPIVEKSASFLQNSLHLLQILNKIDFFFYKENINLFSCDFESLNTNIILELAERLVIETCLEKGCLDNENITLLGLRSILNLIFYYNFFSFKENFFKQIKGIAMGSFCGPTVANIVVYKLELKLVNNS